MINTCTHVLAVALSMPVQTADIYCELYVMAWEAKHRQQSFYYCPANKFTYQKEAPEYPKLPFRQRPQFDNKAGRNWF